MKVRPILFSAPMVHAILDGRKTQTRRIVKPGRDPHVGCQMAPCEIAGDINNGNFAIAPYGIPGDRLWVREAFCPIYPQDPHYMPRNAMDTGYGWKRVCGDFEGHNAEFSGADRRPLE